MRLDIAVALALLLATVGPAVSVPVTSRAVSLDARSNTSALAVYGKAVDESAAMQPAMSLVGVPALNTDGGQAFRRRGELTEFVALLARTETDLRVRSQPPPANPSPHERPEPAYPTTNMPYVAQLLQAANKVATLGLLDNPDESSHLDRPKSPIQKLLAKIGLGRVEPASSKFP
ncbi:hypothetical protein BC835DRAFT_1412676 [Cytidiella melzeri]|nr:hypothetical protein BC835DRAFT_1412676 [Cytidiella melzeri]